MRASTASASATISRIASTAVSRPGSLPYQRAVASCHRGGRQNDACAGATAKFVHVTHVESPTRAHTLQGGIYRGLGKKGQGSPVAEYMARSRSPGIRSVYGQIDTLRYWMPADLSW